jgi:UDP-N-acetylglucosamine diphosphorylase / glucose-1-phosphate thymidylyltransferase / UDP-N-acetylgalactosamine diphosphorylase / glucosamine-1-phosphate N-acetyltransferase / galactosamine-1-phosphate N-acetyltransferase
MQAVIMAAGQSTRTAPLTLTRPKPLLPVMNTPLMERQLNALAGIADEAVLVVGYRGDMIRERFGDAYKDMRLQYVEQREQRGTGHAVLQTADVIRGPFLVLNGDDLYDPADLARLAEQEYGALARTAEDPRRFGVYEIDDNNRVITLEEKPEQPKSNLINIGAYKFTPKVFEILQTVAPSPRGEIEVTDAVQALAKTETFYVVHSEGYYLSIGYPWHLLEANIYWLEHFLVPDIQVDIPPLASVSGPVHIGTGTIIRPGVVIDGPAYIGNNCILGPNCWIRPYTVLGDGCRVGQASEIKASVFFENAAAPHQNYIGDSIIGANTNLACGTTTANLRHDGKNVRTPIRGELVDTGRKKLGAIIGDNVHTGINTSIYPGRKIWPSLTTLPGSTIRFDLDEKPTTRP